MGFFSDILGGATKALTGSSIGGALASTALNSLFNKKPDAPSAPTAQQALSDVTSLYSGLSNLAPQVSYSKPQYGTNPYATLRDVYFNAPSAPQLTEFTGSTLSDSLLSQAADIFSQMASGQDNAAFSEALNTQYGLAQQRGEQAVSDATRALDERLAARGLGRSGVAASQTRQLNQEAGLELASLANQIALANAQRLETARTTGLQGLLSTAQQGYNQAQGIYSTNLAAQQQDFTNKLNLAMQQLSTDQYNTQLQQQNYQNAFNNMQAQFSADRATYQDQASRFNSLIGAASGTTPSQQNFQTALATYQNDLNAYNQGGQAIGSAVASGSNNDITNLQTQILQQQLAQLQRQNTAASSGGIEDYIYSFFGI